MIKMIKRIGIEYRQIRKTSGTLALAGGASGIG
jgi:hypothetical protein